MKKLLSILLISPFTAFILTQEGSLLKPFAQQQSSVPDSTSVTFYLDLADRLEKSDPVNALIFGKKAFVLSREQNDYEGGIRASGHLSRIFTLQGKLDSSLYYNRYSLDAATQRKDSLNIGIALMHVGSTYRRMSDLEAALDYLNQGKEILSIQGDKKALGEMYNAMQLLYYSLPNYEKAIEYGQKAVTTARNLKNDGMLLIALSNLSMSYTDSGQYAASRVNLEEAQTLATKLGDLNAESAILLNLCGIYLKEGDYIRLMEHAERALNISMEIGSRDGECIALRAIAISHLHAKDYITAMEFAHEAKRIAEENAFKMELGAANKVLSNISFAMQDLDEGEHYYRLSEEIVQEVFKESYLQTAALYEERFATKEKDALIQVQNLKIRQRNTVSAIFIGSSILLLIITFLIYRNYSHKQKLQFHRISEMEKQNQLQVAEAVLKGEEQERFRLSKDLHDGLGGILSGIKFSLQNLKKEWKPREENAQFLDRTLDMLDSSIIEMRRIAHNLMPVSLVKFGLEAAVRDYCNEINRSGVLFINSQFMGMEALQLGQTSTIVVYRIIQELINNVIKHAGAQNALVQLTCSGNLLVITVEDDGIGFNPENDHFTSGLGWQNIRNRAEFLGGKVHVASEPGKGTSVQIEIEL